VDGPWGSLSKVINPYSTSIVTKTSTPLLDKNGLQVDNQTLAGAVTVELTTDQAEQASHGNSLCFRGERRPTRCWRKRFRDRNTGSGR
jgi:hypothetical protein